ncbi:von Willebrand factor type A domain protein, putative [Leptolyngbya sp. NIES-3755]|nr:von Willebrand factor type A domain protein, putative [Leptolyngbya sp. NIES-3755]
MQTKSSIALSHCFNPTCKQPENSPSATHCQACETPLLLLDRYRAIRLIGQGGFGRTLLVTDEVEDSRCVVKQFYPQSQSNSEKAAELFRLEAQRLETLGQHSQIPKLLSHFEVAGNQYLVQEWIDGRNLAQELTEVGAFNETQIRHLLQDILPILKFVHDHQVIHRDIKPENIVRRTSDRKLVLVDFGAAKYTTETTLGKTGTMIGSAAYTAPEQVRGKAIYASDLYSLGVTCIHLLTQMSPFELFDSGENKWVWRHYLNKERTRDGFIKPKRKTVVSPWLGTILDKMLESGTTKRYTNAESVLKDLKSKPRRFKKRYVVATITGVVAIAAFGGLRTFVSPVVQQVSPDIITPTSSESTVAGLYSTKSGEQHSFPLQHTEVMARVTGNVSRVEVTQTFTNPFKTPIEAVYMFPLPDEAAVDDMEIRVGDRIIRGVIKKRQEAKQLYETAKQEGKTAGLLEQERDNVFTQSLANIRPGEKIDVKIRYTESLKFEKGSYEFAFPMVVAPRYNPLADAKDTLKSAPATRPGQNIGMTIEIDAGVPIKGVRSTTHQIQSQQDGRSTRIQLQNENTIPNKDFVLQYQVSDTKAQSTTLTDVDQRGGHFATYLIPAVNYQQSEIVPKDIVFLIDTSGSQGGEPIQASKELMRRFIKGLNPDDTFTIIDFASTTQKLSDKPLTNTPENRKRAIDYINKIDANGGSELFNGIQEVLKFPAAPEGRLRSVVLLTDGLVGDDERVIAEVQKNLKPGNRLYSFGVGDSVNRFLIDRVAELGRGTSQIVIPGEPSDKVVEQFFQQINNPVLTNIEVSWEGTGEAPEMYPQKIPDLFANQPIVLFGKKRDRTDGTLKITGTVAGGARFEKRVPVDFAQNSTNSLSGGIAQLWGRSRIKELSNQMFAKETDAGVKAITETALDYRLMSKYTSFVAISQTQRVEPNSSQKVDPVELPPNMQPANGTQTEEVPEPAEIAGSLVAIALLWWRFGRRRAKVVKP